jgi:predicted HTH transcriptional regulator
MNPDLIEELLNEEESATLDFKSQQYPFIKATDDEKGELLKDILAFANAWRRTDAYILVGVKDVKGSRSKVVGIKSDFDDASIQQFVNSKTNRNIEFSYKTITVDGVKIGVLPIQT